MTLVNSQFHRNEIIGLIFRLFLYTWTDDMWETNDDVICLFRLVSEAIYPSRQEAP